MKPQMRRKLAALAERRRELAAAMADPQVIADQGAYAKLAKEFGELEGPVLLYEAYLKAEEQLGGARELDEGSDPDMAELAAAEVADLSARLESMEAELSELLSPESADARRSAIVEIRAGTGGDEATLFAGDLFRMYSRFAEERGWRLEVLESHPTEVGGFKEMVFSVDGAGVFGLLQFEAGVHRVQRVPATESQGRIHTSAATVAVLPEVEAVEVEIDPKDLQIDTYRSSGAGGQHVNVTDSAVRITHVPTGIVVACQDERDQRKNRSKAMRVLRSRVYDHFRRQQEDEISSSRRLQIGSGDRSEKIRTYNFPQNRVTDHRIGKSIHRLDEFIRGDISDMLDALLAASREIE